MHFFNISNSIYQNWKKNAGWLNSISKYKNIYFKCKKTVFYSVGLTVSGSQRKHALDVAAVQERRLMYLWLKENVWMTNALAPLFLMNFWYQHTRLLESNFIEIAL